MSGSEFVPRAFGRYQLVERLAVGGMAEIFKAKSHGAHGFEKTVVIKKILPHLALDRDFIGMFIDEAKLMVRLNHPKIVQVLDFGEIDGEYYMTLEYVDGVDGLALLRQCARRRCRPTTGIVLHIMGDVLDALAHAHSLIGADGERLGVVHRDISPSNIFISRLGEVKLGDFGIARAAFRRESTEAGALKGKYGYMAPEQVSGAAVDGRADIFSVGVVLSEFLMIRRLFYAKSDLEVLLQVRDARVERLDKYGTHIPPDLREILDSALARDPNMRYQEAGVFRDALHRYLFDHRRMVRADDVRKFLVRLTDGDGPVERTAVDPLALPSGEAREPLASDGVRDVVSDSAAAHAAIPNPSDEMTESRPGQSAWKEAATPLQPRAEQPSVVGRKRRIVLTPPPIPQPVPTGLPQTGEEPRIDTASALAAMPEMMGAGSSSRFDMAAAIEDDGMVDLGRLDAGGRIEPSVEEVVNSRMTPPGTAQAGLSGALDDRSLFPVMFRLALAEETGLLVVEQHDVVKEIFLVDGDPQYVTSNRAHELFGQYLISRGVLDKGELSMALAVLPHFNGKLGDALVALKLLRPMEVLRHLTHQVRQKLLDAFALNEGHYRFYPGKLCAHESAPLGLDAFEIMGAAARLAPDDRVARVLDPFLERRPRTVSPAPLPPEVFRLGPTARQAFDRLDGRRTLRTMIELFDDPVERKAFVQTVFLMIATEFAA